MERRQYRLIRGSHRTSGLGLGRGLPLPSRGPASSVGRRLGPGAVGELGRVERKASWKLGAGQLSREKCFSRPEKVCSLLIVLVFYFLFSHLIKEHRYRETFSFHSVGGTRAMGAVDT